jgi:pimeloyl-ACP methyl ester carboxylesterase
VTTESFTIEVASADLEGLRCRLARTRWAPEIANDDWAYGTNGAYLRRLVEYWLDGYDWGEQERRINEYPHFRTVLDGLPIHYLHVRGKGHNALPLVLTHGWPWTFYDYLDVIGPLTDPAAHGGDPEDAFDVVVPSLPGFTFSNPLGRTGVMSPSVPALWDDLLCHQLGYARYGAAGGDLGCNISIQLGLRYPDRIAGVYVSTAPLFLAGGLPRLSTLTEEDYGPGEEGWLDHTRRQWETCQSHIAVHTHDPQTLAWSLNDSPIGLAAWIIERRKAWSDNSGDVEDAFSKDFLLTTVALYWFTQSMGNAIRMYAESFKGSALAPARPPKIQVPMGIGVYPADSILLPKSMCVGMGNVTHWSVLPKGGHFAPSEQPITYVNEIRRFFRPLR